MAYRAGTSSIHFEQHLFVGLLAAQNDERIWPMATYERCLHLA